MIRTTAKLALLYACVAAVNGIALKLSANLGVPSSVAILCRGLVCLASLAVVARTSGLSPVPKRPRIQFVRAIFAGVTLSCLIASYQHLSATTIAAISRLDVPILALVTASAFSNKRTRIALGCASILVLVGTWFVLKPPQESLMGLALLATSVVTVVCGFFFLRHSSQTENILVIAGVPAIACIAFGSLAALSLPAAPIVSSTSLVPLLASGICMYFMYSLSAERYKVLSPGVAEFPVVAGALVVITLEPLILATTLRPLFLAMMALGTIATGLTVYLSGDQVREAPPSRH